MRFDIAGVHHVTFNVTDLDRARDFYEGVLGLERDQDFEGCKLRFKLGPSTRHFEWSGLFTAGHRTLGLLV